MIAQPRTARRAGTGGQDPDNRVYVPVAFDCVHSRSSPVMLCRGWFGNLLLVDPRKQSSAQTGVARSNAVWLHLVSVSVNQGYRVV
jgi:hypothetical protein